MKLTDHKVLQWVITLSISSFFLTLFIIHIGSLPDKKWYIKLLLVLCTNFLSIFIFTLIYIIYLEYNDLAITPEGNIDGDRLTPYNIFYFAFVVQTTIGFGEIIPQTGIARTIVILHGTVSLLIDAAIASELITEIGTENITKMKKSLMNIIKKNKKIIK